MLNDKTVVVSVLRHIKSRFRARATTTELRRFAVEQVARLDRQKYRNPNSALKTVHDACARRYRPDIKSIAHFDRLVDDWRSGDGSELQSILLKHATRTINRLF